jgi:Mitochondrial small ribosomal subunit Rsm22
VIRTQWSSVAPSLQALAALKDESQHLQLPRAILFSVMLTSLPRAMLRSRVMRSMAASAAPVVAAGVEPITHSKRPRRLSVSPTLPLEAVAVEAGMQRAIERVTASSKLSSRDVRKASRSLEVLLSPDSLPSRRRPKKKSGPPIVPAPADYSAENIAIASAVTRAPASLAANVYVMSELRRCRPDLVPQTILDFGAGVAPSVSAAARVFRRPSHNPTNIASARTSVFANEKSTKKIEAQDVLDPSTGSNHESLIEKKSGSDGEDGRQGERRGRAQLDWVPSGSKTTLRSVVLVDQAHGMRRMGADLLRSDAFLGLAPPKSSPSTSIAAVSSLREAGEPHGGRTEFDIVSASFSLSEIVRSAMAMADGVDTDSEGHTRSRSSRESSAERRLRATVRTLWRCVKPGGVLVIVEDGTVGGFETVLFARQTLLGMNDRKRSEPLGNEDDADDAEDIAAVSDFLKEDHAHAESLTRLISVETKAKVLAPCLHSQACPLAGTTTRHRVCRFVQRLNRPLYLRTAKPMSTGYEDTFFSYAVVEKAVVEPTPVSASKDSTVDIDGVSDAPWGRVVRGPLRRGKHVILDCCTHEGELERRTVSKKSAPDGVYSLARKARWGDIWPMPAPGGNPQTVNF